MTQRVWYWNRLLLLYKSSNLPLIRYLNHQSFISPCKNKPCSFCITFSFLGIRFQEKTITIFTLLGKATGSMNFAFLLQNSLKERHLSSVTYRNSQILNYSIGYDGLLYHTYPFVIIYLLTKFSPLSMVMVSVYFIFFREWKWVLSLQYSVLRVGVLYSSVPFLMVGMQFRMVISLSPCSLWTRYWVRQYCYIQMYTSKHNIDSYSFLF